MKPMCSCCGGESGLTLHAWGWCELVGQVVEVELAQDEFNALRPADRKHVEALLAENDQATMIDELVDTLVKARAQFRLIG